MCCCGTPSINGTLGYRWQPNDAPIIRQVDPPALQDKDVLLYDEPGRCGGLDCHSHHYRLVKWYSSVFLAVKHGGGEERFRVSTVESFMAMLAALDSNGRYWVFHSIYYAHHYGAEDAAAKEASAWRKAAVDKRIKTRKFSARGVVKVWIEPAQIGGAA